MSVNLKQQLTWLTTLATNMNWDAINSDQLQAGIGDPVSLGKQGTLFAQLGGQVQIGEHFRETGEISLQLPTLKRPTLKELQSKYDWIKSIERDTSTEAPVTMVFATVLVPSDGNSINGAEYEKRIVPKHDSLLGLQHRDYILEHQDEFPELKPFLGKCYIDFPGIVVVRRDGGRDVPYCVQSGSRWDDDWRWLRGGFGSNGRIAVGE